MELRALAYPSGHTHFSGLDFFHICRKASPCRDMVPGTYRLRVPLGLKLESTLAIRIHITQSLSLACPYQNVNSHVIQGTLTTKTILKRCVQAWASGHLGVRD